MAAMVTLLSDVSCRKKKELINYKMQKKATEDSRHECLRSTAVPMFSGLTRCQRFTHPLSTHTHTHTHTQTHMAGHMTVSDDRCPDSLEVWRRWL